MHRKPAIVARLTALWKFNKCVPLPPLTASVDTRFAQVVTNRGGARPLRPPHPLLKTVPAFTARRLHAHLRNHDLLARAAGKCEFCRSPAGSVPFDVAHLTFSTLLLRGGGDV
jgi:hypothetical protein